MSLFYYEFVFQKVGKVLLWSWAQPAFRQERASDLESPFANFTQKYNL